MKTKAVAGMMRSGSWKRPDWLNPFGSGRAVLASLATTLGLVGLGVFVAVRRQPHLLQGDGDWGEAWRLLWPAELAASITAGLVILSLLYAIWPVIAAVARGVQHSLTAVLSAATQVLRAVLVHPMRWMARQAGAALRWIAAVTIQPTSRRLAHLLRLLAGMVDRLLVKSAWPPIRRGVAVFMARLTWAVHALVHSAISGVVRLVRMAVVGLSAALEWISMLSRRASAAIVQPIGRRLLFLLRLLGGVVGQTLVKGVWPAIRRGFFAFGALLTRAAHVLAQLTNDWAWRPIRTGVSELSTALRWMGLRLRHVLIRPAARLVLQWAAVLSRLAAAGMRWIRVGLGLLLGSLRPPLATAGRGLAWLFTRFFNGLHWVLTRGAMAATAAVWGAGRVLRNLRTGIGRALEQALRWLIPAAGPVLSAVRAAARSGLLFLARSRRVVMAGWAQAMQGLTAMAAALRAGFASLVSRLALGYAVRYRRLREALVPALARLREGVYMPRRQLRLWPFVVVGGILVIFAGCQPVVPAAPCSGANSRSVEVCIYSSDTKQDWLNAVTSAFNAGQFKTKGGKPVTVYAFHVNSGTSQQDILSGKIRPTVWSPGDQSWVDGANQAWQETHARPLIPNACQATVYAPVGFAMWRPMAEALGWPDTPVSWDTLVALSADPQGWGRYGHPEWGAFKFGHTHPDHSNSGLLLLTALAYSTFDRTSGLTPEMVESQPFVDALRSVELNTYHYGLRSKDLLGLMVRRGPDYLHATNTSEADTLKTNREQADALRFPLAFIFPAEGTFWTEQPYCVLDTDWVSADQHEGAQIFEAYLHERPQQELAVSYNLRPVDGTIPLGATFTLENGTDPRVTLQTVPALASPSGEVAEAVKHVFHETKKKATVLLVLDTSGSMGGDKIKNAREATANFIGRLEAEDEVAVSTFASAVSDLEFSGPAGEVAEPLSQAVLQQAAGGGTALYDAVCAAVERMQQQQAEDVAAGERRLDGIVLLSDGVDTANTRTRESMFSCLPSGDEVEGIKIYTIAYGSDADKGLLEEIAKRTNGKAFSADPATIEQVYLAISAEQ